MRQTPSRRSRRGPLNKIFEKKEAEMVKLTRGSIFDKKCDLLIIPCNSHGGVTSWVLKNLKENQIPVPTKKIPLGKVLFLETGLQFENAEVVGFAASVDEFKTSVSSKEAITSIGQEIASYCRDHELRQVNIPLLGAGAGGLSTFESFEGLIANIASVEYKDILFEIFTPELKVS